jgi:CheY-like chemotaxis protein
MDNPDSKCILIAATDPNIIYLLQRYAEASGFHSVQCELGANLIHHVKKVQPVLILMQIDHPESTWRHSVNMLKTDPVTEGIPIIAYSYIEELNSCQVTGITSILQKSVLYGDFLIALENAGVSPE